MAETILVVEDEPTLCQLLAGALSVAGYRVYQARDGNEATAVFAKHESAIDLLITDLELPYLDGSQLIQVLRKRRPDLKVLCISGIGQPPAEADGFIAKPFSRESLLTQVRTILARPATANHR
jgi:two-component system cell cycle sensor histidine kinase/response regulator CckA